ncbi:MAG: FtsK/SpoIIIE domain-containing protein [Oscillospiraceae bacterium]|nr:FtsK/SpoIIIE domain-containing protein [Oscillospiraceae bacterium]
MNYTVYITSGDTLSEYHLCLHNKKKISIDLHEKDKSVPVSISFEVTGDDVYAVSDNTAAVLDNRGHEIMSARLYDGFIYSLRSRKSSAIYPVAVRRAGISINRFLLYSTEGKNEIKIGSSSADDICINSHAVNTEHAYILCEDNGYYIEACVKGEIYINGRRTSSRQCLNRSDVIYLAGVKIIFLGDIICVNCCDSVHVSLKRYKGGYEPPGGKKESVIRTPVCHDLPDMSPVVLSCSHDDTDDSGHVRNYGEAALTSVISASVLTYVFSVYLQKPSLPGLIFLFSGLTAAAAVLWCAVVQAAGKLAKCVKLIKDRKLDSAFAGHQLSLLEERVRQNAEILRSRYPGAQYTADLLYCPDDLVRRRDSDDFLCLRIGAAGVRSEISLSPQEAVMYYRDTIDKILLMDDVPVLADLKKERIIQIKGNTDEVYMMAYSLIVCAAASHSARDVKLAILCKADDIDSFRWAGWLPHCLSDENSFRYISGSESTYTDVMYCISDKLSERTALRVQGYTERFFPHYIIFCTDLPSAQQSAVNKYMFSKYDLGATFIILNSDENFSMNECHLTCELTDKFRGIVRCGTKGNVTMDFTDMSTADTFARRLAGKKNYTVTRHMLPDCISFFKLNEISQIQKISITQRYNVNHAYEGLRVNLGTDAAQKIFVLDIGEKNHGPHGLVAGMTGSGKSEVLQNIILSLAMNYHPDEVSMILIDYKGGGMSQLFENLPHVRGVLTNLDTARGLSSVIYRACTAIKNEIRRRQELLKKYKLSHVDKYMKMYLKGLVSMPLPHIVIIVDEFAELKKENPEFISELISISRIGRSLGIHLILATQKPAGVIDEQIWSNSSFRICLKVQDKADSLEMLRRPEASTLKIAGRAYVQVGNDEIFELIQTAYSGGKYTDDDASYMKMVDTDLSEMVLHTAAVNDETGAGDTQAGILADFIMKSARENRIDPLPPLWLDPPADSILLDDVLMPGESDFSQGIICVPGLADDTDNQKIYPAVIDIGSSGSILISGDSGSGKTTLINTMLYSMVSNYSPLRLKIAVMDFESSAFSIYSKLPHTLKILSPPDEEELAAFLDELISQMKIRKKTFAQKCAGNYNEYNARYSDMAAVVVCIDGFYSFSGLYPQFADKFELILRDCCRYGIYFIVSIKHLSDMKLRTRRNFGTQAALRSGDVSEYAQLLSYVPAHGIRDNPGYVYLHSRGSCEFQTALITCDNSESVLRKFMSEKFGEIVLRYKDTASDKDDGQGRENDCLCRCLDVRTRKDYLKAASLIIQENISVLQWIPEGDDRYIIEGAQVFAGMQGAYDMLVKLRKEFERRKSQKRPLSVTHRVFLGSLYEFCSCVYSHDSFDGMSEITETFFQRAQGYGIEFVGYRDAAGLCMKYKAAEVFLHVSRGEEECLIF